MAKMVNHRPVKNFKKLSMEDKSIALGRQETSLLLWAVITRRFSSYDSLVLLFDEQQVGQRGNPTLCEYFSGS
jgi:hypothetical protein